MIILSGLLIIGGILLASSAGQPKPFRDHTGNPIPKSLSEKVFIDVGGMKQGMILKSKDTGAPVLLYIHGGMPDYFLTRKYPTGLDDLFTVAWWEQRGSGISYSPDIPAGSITLDQMLDDVVEVSDYLRHRFGQEKIYLMGHSGGTFLGIQAAARYPELYHAYIGVAQMSDQLRSERLAYEYILDSYTRQNDKKMVQKLAAAPVTDTIPDAYLKLRDKAMHSLGIGTMREMNSVIGDIFIPSLLFNEYSLKEKLNMWRGKAKSGVSSLWDEILTTNLMETVPKVDIPVYFFEGIYDYTVSYTLAQEYFESLQAPVKGFYTFEESAHSPMFEQPGKMQRILQNDVLNRVNYLADVK